MNSRRQFQVVLLGLFSTAMGSHSWGFVQESETPDQLSLADLAGYRAALVRDETGDGAKGAEPETRVGFKDLWNRPAQFRGRRVTVQGRIVRIFRQGPVGSFPPLAEIWITSRQGDPFCLVSPQAPRAKDLPVADHGRRNTGEPPETQARLQVPVKPEPIPELGQTIRFTGTFLKLVRYAAKDGARLAPLVVGDAPPVADARNAGGRRSPPADRSFAVRTRPGESFGPWSWSLSSWALGLILAALAAGVIVWQHLRAPSRRAAPRHGDWRTAMAVGNEPPLEFIENGGD